jgi:Transposase DDE domain
VFENPHNPRHDKCVDYMIEPQVKGFMVRPWCWIVERTLAWVDRCRQLGKDYERKVQTSEHLIQIAMIRLMVRRLVQRTRGFLRYALSSTLYIVQFRKGHRQHSL